MLKTIAAQHWDDQFSSGTQQLAIDSLENGHILFFPDLAFHLRPDEHYLLSPDHADPHSKNIVYNPKGRQLWGVQRLTDEQRMQLKSMLDRFSMYAGNLIRGIFPKYQQDLITARTSFRPLQISGRKTSYRKDDKRLHIDAFPSAPNQGKRILRVFCNINPEGADRVWRIGESFEQVAARFLTEIKKPTFGASTALRLLRITKSYRTRYDHYMLHLHDRMKADDRYQETAQQQEVRFPPGSSWIVQTDHVSHAAMHGQHVLEQTFYLPVQAMFDETRSPLRILERMLAQKLV